MKHLRVLTSLTACVIAASCAGPVSRVVAENGAPGSDVVSADVDMSPTDSGFRRARVVVSQDLRPYNETADAGLWSLRQAAIQRCMAARGARYTPLPYQSTRTTTPIDGPIDLDPAVAERDGFRPSGEPPLRAWLDAVEANSSINQYYELMEGSGNKPGCTDVAFREVKGGLHLVAEDLYRQLMPSLTGQFAGNLADYEVGVDGKSAQAAVTTCISAKGQDPEVRRFFSRTGPPQPDEIAAAVAVAQCVREAGLYARAARFSVG